MDSLNLTKLLGAKRDRYACRQGDWIVSDQYILIGPDTWSYVRSLTGLTFRVLYRCKDGAIRDMIGRQGVHKSAQDGPVRGVGHPMASEENGTLSFWTATHGDKVNTGAGKGYRTLRAEGILALRIKGETLLTMEGFDTITLALRQTQ